MLGRRPHPPAVFGEAKRGPAASKTHGMHVCTLPGPGRSSSRPAVMRGRQGKGEPVTDDERLEEVRLGRSSEEAGEQGAVRPGGAGGAKARAQGKSARPPHAPGTGPGKRVTGGGADTASCMARPAATRHHPREEPGALARTPGSARGDRGNPVPYRDLDPTLKHAPAKRSTRSGAPGGIRQRVLAV